jgi:beta-lactamase regulating signal transducer with metallopeptidase domain
MLNEILIALLLSISTTALLLSMAKLFQKIWKIRHPKNTFWIYIIVLFTAASIFPYASLAFSSTQNDDNIQKIDILDFKGIPISNSTIITENQNITYSSSITKIPNNKTNKDYSITQYLQTISWNEMKLLDDDYNIKTEQINSKQTNIEELNTSQLIKKTFSISSIKGEIKTPELLNQIITNLIIDENNLLQNQKHTTTLETNTQQKTNNQEEKNKINNISSLSNENKFYLAILILFFITVTYIILALHYGKKYTLKRLKAKKCKNSEVIALIKSIAKEFKIKTPDIYSFHGSPNAFVLGFPTILVFSKELQHYLNKNEFEAAMRHELAHIKNHDVIIKPILQGIRLFFFYNPFIHILALKIMKNREILADISTYTTKKQKISLMEALIKVNEFTPNKNNRSLVSNQLPLITYNPARLTLSERFSNLFGNTTKKTILTSLVICIILLGNISIFCLTDSIFDHTITSTEKNIEYQEFSIDKSYYTESVKYTKIQKNAKTYFAMIIHRNLYNLVSTETISSEDIEDMIHNIFPSQNNIIINTYNSYPF